MRTQCYFVLATILLVSSYSFSQNKVSIESLLKEMVDRSELAKYPEPSYTCKQFSTYSRASVAKDKLGWFDNNDWSMFLRVENKEDRKEFVMVDAEGPGAIVRWWMTFGGKEPGQGTMRVYIDDMETPAIEANPFDLLSGNALTIFPLAASVSEKTEHKMRGHNLYFPLPYSKRCKITYESKNLFEDKPGLGLPDGEAVYYNINYRTYEPGTKVTSFSTSEMKKNKSLIESVSKKLQKADQKQLNKKSAQLDLSVGLLPGESKTFEVKGGKALQQLTMKLKADDQEQALRSTVLEIKFDDENTVWTPVGDFYGIGHKQILTDTWYTQTDVDGMMNAYWVMPFQRKCEITIHNLGKQPVEITEAFAAYDSWKWDKRSMYFGTTWLQYTNVTTYPPHYCSDLNFNTLQGKGVLVGDAVSVYNTAHGWWGEGDEKIYVDGESFPSHFGTGTEDYYGYAWCSPEIFTGHPYLSQPIGEASLNAGTSINIRYRSLDKIPFKESIQFDMELFQHWVKSRWNYAPVTYWYALPGGKSTVEKDFYGARHKVANKRSDVYSPAVQLTIEGENLLPVKLDNGKIEYQTGFRELWSDAMQLFWYDGKVGDRATFEFDCAFPGIFDLTSVFTKAPDYGVFHIYLNGVLAFSGLNLYNHEVILTEVVKEAVELKKGKNTLTVEIIGNNPKQEKANFGIDRLAFTVRD